MNEKDRYEPASTYLPFLPFLIQFLMAHYANLSLFYSITDNPFLLQKGRYYQINQSLGRYDFFASKTKFAYFYII